VTDDGAANRTLGVLLVEDDPGDVVIAKEAMRAGNLTTQLDVVSDGIEAMAYLRHEGKYARPSVPT
jgi:two-component system, chemotaxis family, response regulator Rcp1